MADSKKLKRTVVLTNPESNKTFTFRAGRTLPDWAAKIATNPKLFQEGRIATPNKVRGDAGGLFVQDAVQQPSPRQVSEIEEAGGNADPDQ